MVELDEQTTSEASRHIIERPRLTRLLDEATARVIMLVAPAGYGKTTLARQWLADRPHVWFEANRASADVASLVREIGHALAPAGEVEGNRLELLRSIHDVDTLEALADLQAEQIGTWPRKMWFVIDEYEMLGRSRASNEYVELLLRASTINLLLTSRITPTWATPRKRLYGDYLLVERGELAMTDPEAREVLRRRGHEDVPGLVSAAAGWPAVLGLASLTKGLDLDGTLPQTLYDYFADELFRNGSAALQDALPQLALVSTISPALVAATFGIEDSAGILAEAKELGFLSDGARGLVFQPLLRAFLRRKSKVDTQGSDETVDRLVAFLLDIHEWDEAFEVIDYVSGREALLELIERAHESLLKSGRTATLTSWLEVAERMGIHAASLDLIRAELAIRHGSPRYAEQLAIRVYDQTPERSIATKALSIAGRAAHLDNRGSDSLSHFRAAGELADCDRDRHHAAWGALLAAQDMESDDELSLVLESFLRYGTDSPDDAVRAANARLAIGLTKHGFLDALEPALATVRTFRESADPVPLSSLLNSLSRSMSLVARYQEAERLSEEELEVATAASLRFVMPFAHVAKAAALIGLARYREADDHLTLAIRHAEELSDDHNVFDALTVRARAAIAQRQFERAADLTSNRADTSGLSSGMRAEYTATRGLALACAGDTAGAAAALVEAAETSSIPEAIAIVSCGRAVVALRQGSTTLEAAAELERAFDLAVLDPVVITCRAYSPVVQVAKETHRHLPERLVHAMLMEQSPYQQDELLATLTPREKEVLDLLTRGYTNREIATALVIEESTAKVHVRRIIRKLGVRSRTEAAIVAVQRRRLGETSTAPHGDERPS
ncbi:MAG TPA: LuxR C-terminal-related transcriptional regulator [Gaiellaceae bacterium]|nr:LuxR C-terminal-related transcriptional regulator [Gaiellaceae bacterium]